MLKQGEGNRVSGEINHTHDWPETKDDGTLKQWVWQRLGQINHFWLLFVDKTVPDVRFLVRQAILPRAESYCHILIFLSNFIKAVFDSFESSTNLRTNKKYVALYATMWHCSSSRSMMSWLSMNVFFEYSVEGWANNQGKIWTLSLDAMGRH